MYCWSELPGMVKTIKWPVRIQKVNQPPATAFVKVFCHSDNCYYRVKSRQLKSFPDDNIEKTSSGILSKKNMTKTLELFNKDLLWIRDQLVSNSLVKGLQCCSDSTSVNTECDLIHSRVDDVTNEIDSVESEVAKCGSANIDVDPEIDLNHSLIHSRVNDVTNEMDSVELEVAKCGSDNIDVDPEIDLNHSLIHSRVDDVTNEMDSVELEVAKCGSDNIDVDPEIDLNHSLFHSRVDDVTTEEIDSFESEVAKCGSDNIGIDPEIDLNHALIHSSVDEVTIEEINSVELEVGKCCSDNIGVDPVIDLNQSTLDDVIDEAIDSVESDVMKCSFVSTCGKPDPQHCEVIPDSDSDSDGRMSPTIPILPALRIVNFTHDTITSSSSPFDDEDGAKDGDLDDDEDYDPHIDSDASDEDYISPLKRRRIINASRIQSSDDDSSDTDSDIIPSKVIPTIYIKKIKTSNVTKDGKKKKRSRQQNSYHACYFCGVMVQHIQTHTQLKHGDESEVKEILNLKKLKDNTLLSLKQSILRAKGDHKHNLEVIKNQQGEFLLFRRSTEESINHLDYGPCPSCLQWMLKNSLSKHQKTCAARLYQKKIGNVIPIANKRTILLEMDVLTEAIPQNTSDLMRKEVFPILTPDEITNVAKKDRLILAIGESQLRKNIDNKLKRKYYSSQRMRLCARFLIELRKLDAAENGNETGSNKQIWDFMRPSKFDMLAEAGLQTAMPDIDDFEELKSPSNALKIKYDLLKMISVKFSTSIREMDKCGNEHDKLKWLKQKNVAEECKFLLENEWNEKVTRLARSVLESRKMGKNVLLPDPKDIEKLGKYLPQELKNLDLSGKDVSWEKYRLVIQLTQSRLMAYNKRRSGELEAIRLQNYLRKKSVSDVDEALMGDLSDLDKYLLKNQTLIETRGKRGRTVPVLIPADTVKPMQFLADASVRRSAGIYESNDFLFANRAPNGILRTYDSVQTTCAEAGLKCPERITSTNMRKYMATLAQVITPFRNLVLCADSRRDMEEWSTSIKSAASKEYYDPNASHREMMSGHHNWYACSHARPTYCNICREALSGVTSHGLSCEVCKFKTHKRCAARAPPHCKWTMLASIGKNIIENEDGIFMSHQWLEGNLPVSAKCSVCDKNCGSVLRLQDLRCLWCRAMVHTACAENYTSVCPLGQCSVSVLPPTAINSMDSDGYWEASRPPGTSPLLVFVNTKSGDNQGVKFLRRFKQLLNPAQVFDLMNGGPYPGLRLFQKFDSFRILVCGGDGSIGWVLSEIDKLDLHRQCQVGVLPFGTGNDLARVLGWGAAYDNGTQLPVILEKMEHSLIKMLDRWSIWTYEGTMPPPRKLSQQVDPISRYEDSVATHLSKILQSEDHSIVLNSARVLCETVKDFVAKVAVAHEQDKDEEESISNKCNVLNEKLEGLLNTLNEEAEASTAQVKPPEVKSQSDVDVELHSSETDSVPGEITGPPRPTKSVIFKPRDALMCRANSLKKAIRQIIEHTERAVDEQNAQTEQQELDLKERYGINPSNGSNEHFHDSGKLSSISAPSFTIFTSEAMTQAETAPPPPEQERPISPMQTSRRISSMSAFHRSSSVGSNLHTKRDKSPVRDTIPLSVLDIPSDFSSLPGLSSNIAGRLAGGSFISKVLLANADALCAATLPLITEDMPLEEYTERCVMNNYFGIGLDAKITLDFQNKREEHPEKCRSRTKNLMWYGVLGTKEILQRTFKNLDQRVQLECDGQRIPLPSLQGIVILNIPSFGGGSNFWGGRKEDDNFTAPSFDDKILEVVAVFGSVQMAVSRVIDIQHHRIAQCRSAKITILGDEGVPVQVDGEAWTQPPGYIRIIHKNRAQMLTRDRGFESILKSWSEKQKHGHPLNPIVGALSEEECVVFQDYVDAASALIRCVKVAAMNNTSIEQELFPYAMQSSEYLDRLYPSGRLSALDTEDSETEPYQVTLKSQVLDFIRTVRSLYNEANTFLAEKDVNVHLNHTIEEELAMVLSQVEVQMKKIAEIGGVFQTSQEDIPVKVESKQSKPGRFKQVYSKLKGKSKEKESKDPKMAHVPPAYNVKNWSPEEVGQWLSSLSLGEYQETFISHEIRGSELLTLERGDMKDLGVTKVGHLKRIQQGIKDLHVRMSVFEKAYS